MGDSPTKIKIIIIEDDQFQLRLLSSQFEMLGYQDVTAFDDGPTALEYMSGRKLDWTVMVLNLDMLVQGQANFLKKLKEDNFTGGLLLISNTGERRVQPTADRKSPFNLNIIGHLKKPVQQGKLQKSLTKFSLRKENVAGSSTQQRYTVERLVQAIEAGELRNVYQPKVLLSTGELVGVEALVRWEHPQDGMILPGQFIGLAEESSLIDKIARQVVRNALIDSTYWKDLGAEITVSVNISMYNLNTRDFVSYLENELSNSGVRPQNLTLEITESKLMEDYSMVLDMLTRLRLRRVNLSIDDFGTGKYTASQLRDIPFNELKIDRGFVHTAHDNVNLHDVVDGSMRVAKNLGIKTVGEGVEDEADWNYLGDSGCDSAQGFFIGKPMKAEDLVGWQGQWADRFKKLAG